MEVVIRETEPGQFTVEVDFDGWLEQWPVEAFNAEGTPLVRLHGRLVPPAVLRPEWQCPF